MMLRVLEAVGLALLLVLFARLAIPPNKCPQIKSSATESILPYQNLVECMRAGGNPVRVDQQSIVCLQQP